MHFCCFEAEGKCLYNRSNFHTSRKVVKRSQSTVICIQRGTQISSTIYCLISWAHEGTKQISVSTSTIHLPNGTTNKQVGGFLFAETGIFQSHFTKQNKMEMVLG